MSIINTLPFQLQNGTTADATQVMADFNQIVSNVNANGASNGANDDITALLALTTPISPGQGGTSTYYGGTSTGTANAQIAATTTPTGFSLVAGKRATFIAGFTNTGPLQLNIGGTGLVNAYLPTASGPVALVSGEVKSGNIVEVEYDGTQYQILNTNLNVLGTLANLVAAATTDLGTAATHNINITGAAAITAFGSAASVALPIYFLTFVGINTLTYNATSLILPGAANIVTAAGDTAIAQYLGSGNWLIWSYQRASGSSPVPATALPGAVGFSFTNNVANPSTQFDYSARQVVMVNSAGASFFASAPSGTINSANIGVVNGIQVARANSTFYDAYWISNGSTTGMFLVPHGTALSAPSGYTFSAQIGDCPTDSSGNFFRIKQLGNEVQYVVNSATNTTVAALTMKSGSQGDPTIPTFVTVSVSTFIPASATRIRAYVGQIGGAAILLPNANYAVTSNSAPSAPYMFGGGADGSMVADLLLETTNLSYASSGANSWLVALGWKTNVNAS